MSKVQRAHGLGIRAMKNCESEIYIVVTEFNKSTEYNVPFFEL